ncbi:hypothetical protein JOE33_000106 [Pseudomonas sp. PvP027]|nr:hypothetical protein [Pseudomonas sp. PvP027]
MPLFQTQRWHQPCGSEKTHDGASTATYIGTCYGASRVKIISLKPFRWDALSKSRSRRPLDSLPLTLRLTQIRNEETSDKPGVSLSPFFNDRHLSSCFGSSKGNV